MKNLHLSCFSWSLNPKAFWETFFSTCQYHFLFLSSKHFCVGPISLTSQNWPPEHRQLLKIPNGTNFVQNFYFLRCIMCDYRKYFIVSRAYSKFLTFFCGFTFKWVYYLSWAKILGRKIPSSYSERQVRLESTWF